VSSWGRKRIDLFCKGDDTELQHRSWDGETWTSWATIGAGISDIPSAVSWGKNRIDVVALGVDGQLLHKHFSATESS
jgi:sialidase-1